MKFICVILLVSTLVAAVMSMDIREREHKDSDYGLQGPNVDSCKLLDNL